MQRMSVWPVHIFAVSLHSTEGYPMDNIHAVIHIYEMTATVNRNFL